MRNVSVLVLVAAVGCNGGQESTSAESYGDDFDLRVRGVEYCDGRDNNRDGTVDEGCGVCSFEVTRNTAFWASSTCVLEGNAPGLGDLLPVSVGSGLVFDDAADLTGFLSAAPAGVHDRLALQIATARLNIAAFGVGGAVYSDVTGDGVDDDLDTIVATADALYDSGSLADQRRLARLLTRINASGVGLDSWFDASCVAEPEICNGVDDDGDGTTDEVCSCVEVCDGFDTDFDGVLDNGCPVDCPTEPVDGCVTLAEAVSSGSIGFTNSADGVTVSVWNHGADALCLDDYMMVTSPGTQAFMWGADVGGSDGLVIAPGGSVSLKYGSWTTDNNYYEPYLGQSAWWCIEASQFVAGGATFEVFGEVPPPALVDIVTGSNDYDGDGVEDHVDWQGIYGVATNYAIWDYQATSTAMTVGKAAWLDGTTIEVALTVRNAGAVGGTGEVVDVVPAGWTVTSSSPAASTTTLGDGATELVWSVGVEGYADGGLTLDAAEVSYTITRASGADSPKVALGEATVSYFDGWEDQTSRSLGAFVWGYDGNLDGIVTCDE
jgi:hypothetical protein